MAWPGDIPVPCYDWATYWAWLEYADGLRLLAGSLLISGNLHTAVSTLATAEWYTIRCNAWLGQQQSTPTPMTDDAILAAVFRGMMARRDMPGAGG